MRSPSKLPLENRFGVLGICGLTLLAFIAGCGVGSKETPRANSTISVGDHRSQVIKVLEDGGAVKVWPAVVGPAPPDIGESYQLPSGETIDLVFVPSGEKGSPPIYLLDGIVVCKNPDQPVGLRQSISVQQFTIPGKAKEN